MAALLCRTACSSRTACCAITPATSACSGGQRARGTIHVSSCTPSLSTSRQAMVLGLPMGVRNCRGSS